MFITCNPNFPLRRGVYDKQCRSFGRLRNGVISCVSPSTKLSYIHLENFADWCQIRWSLFWTDPRAKSARWPIKKFCPAQRFFFRGLLFSFLPLKFTFFLRKSYFPLDSQQSLTDHKRICKIPIKVVVYFPSSRQGILWIPALPAISCGRYL